MDYIYNLISDGDLTDEISMGLRNRVLEQKIMYLEEWSTVYYGAKNKDSIYSNLLPVEDFIDTAINWDNNISKTNYFISLWCWDSNIEKNIFNFMWDKYWNIDYFGVDSSRSMLELSIDNLKEVKNVNKKYICADFSTNVFRRELVQMIGSNKNRLFTFFSNTFWNILPTNIIDILFNLLTSGEKIWLDVRLRPWIKAKDDMKMFNFYNKYLNEEHFFLPLKKYWVPFTNWKMILSTHNEDSIWAIRFDFSFLFTKKTKIMAKNEEIIVLPKENIKLQQIYVYDSTLLIKFFEEHGFKLIKFLDKDYRGMFLFEKV